MAQQLPAGPNPHRPGLHTWAWFGDPQPGSVVTGSHLDSVPDGGPFDGPLGIVSAFAPLAALGNTVIVVPSEAWPLAATDLYHIIDTSDIPGGVINIVTGLRAELAPVLAAHDDVDGLWYFPCDEGGADVERLSAGNMKRTWVAHGNEIDWSDPRQAEGEHMLRRATEVKNIWIPYGE